MKKFTLAICGGIAAGKTTATEFFINQGLPVLDADLVAKDLTSNNKKIITSIVEYFGKDVLTHENTLNRAKLRNIIFNNKDAKLWLEQLLHPKIQAQIIATKAKLQSNICIIALPLINKNSREIYDIDMILSIISDIDLRIKRLIKRDGISAEEAKTIIANQISDSELTELSDITISNNDSLESLHIKLQQIYASIDQI